MVETHTVLEVADGVLYLGVATMVGLQFQGLAVPVGDEQGQLRAGRGLHPPDDEPRRLRARGFSKRAGRQGSKS